MPMSGSAMISVRSSSAIRKATIVAAGSAATSAQVAAQASTSSLRAMSASERPV
jgi:hypothetical protein